MNKEFSWPIRVYYEDTDAAGVVYHSNYLKFMERARTEWLRSIGISQTELAKETGAIIVISEVEMKFLLPAKLDDALEVTSRLAKVSGASFMIMQTITREEDVLCRADVKGVCLDALSFKPRRLPDQLKKGLNHVE